MFIIYILALYRYDPKMCLQHDAMMKVYIGCREKFFYIQLLLDKLGLYLTTKTLIINLRFDYLIIVVEYPCIWLTKHQSFFFVS